MTKSLWYVYKTDTQVIIRVPGQVRDGDNSSQSHEEREIPRTQRAPSPIANLQRPDGLT